MIPVAPGRETWFILLLLVQYPGGLILRSTAHWWHWPGALGGTEAMKLAAPLIVVATT